MRIYRDNGKEHGSYFLGFGGFTGVGFRIQGFKPRFPEREKRPS